MRSTHTELEFGATDATTPNLRSSHVEIEFGATDTTNPNVRATLVEIEWGIAQNLVLPMFRAKGYLID